MTVSKLIEELQKYNGAAKVIIGYDGNYAVTEPEGVETYVDSEYDRLRYVAHAGEVLIYSKN
jgi:hypothetical protein